jgi:hypothetical protein
MTKHSTIATGMFFGVLCLAGAVDAQVADGGSYRVDMEFTQDGERITMRRYVDGARSRIETAFDGQTYITIELGDAAGTTYILMPEEKQAMKTTAASSHAVNTSGSAATPENPSVAAASSAPPMELVGTETIDGKSARKYRIKMPEGEGFVWLDVERELPLRMESGDQTVDMKNYDFAPLPAELFQVPKGYDVIDLDQLMRQSSASSMILRGAVGAVGTSAGASAGSQLGASAGASIGGAVGGPIGAMIGSFLGQHLGKKAGQKAGAAAAGVIP